MREITATDLIKHFIDLKPNARPVFAKIPRCNRKEREFAANIFPLMEESGIIVRGFSEWGARSKFPPKKKGSEELRVIHNFISVNSQTVKPQYPTHRIEEVVEIIIKPKFTVFFGTNASNGYWAVPMKAGHEYKTGIVTPHGQYFYRRMEMGLKGAAHIYAQFTDLMFGPLPATGEEEAYNSMIGDHGDVAFSPFVDDHLSSAKGFEEMFDFLHEVYFPRCAFGPIYLAPKKTFVFTDQLDFVGFTGDRYGLRPSIKHIEQIRNWPTPTTKDELEAFLYLTPFLRIFIPGRAEHALIMKKAYLKREQVPLTSERGKGRVSVRERWVDTGEFHWGEDQEKSFMYVKKAISENAMSGSDPDKQFHLATDASKWCVEGALFQLANQSVGTEVLDKHR